MTRRHVPDDTSRRYVETAAGLGATQPDIAAIMKISVSSLLKHYRKELDVGVAKANLKVAGKLFSAATAKEHTQANVTAAIFWMKSRGRWKEVHQVEHVDEAGNPLPPRPLVQVLLPDNGRDLPPQARPPRLIEGQRVELGD